MMSGLPLHERQRHLLLRILLGMVLSTTRRPKGFWSSCGIEDTPLVSLFFLLPWGFSVSRLLSAPLLLILRLMQLVVAARSLSEFGAMLPA